MNSLSFKTLSQLLLRNPKLGNDDSYLGFPGRQRVLDPNSQGPIGIDCFLRGFWDAACSMRNGRSASTAPASGVPDLNSDPSLPLARTPSSDFKTITGMGLGSSASRLHSPSSVVHPVWSPTNLLRGNIQNSGQVLANQHGRWCWSRVEPSLHRSKERH